MNATEEITSFWGGSLGKWSSASLDELDFPPSVKRYLVEVGLPVGQDWDLDFEGGGQPPQLLDSNLVIGRDGTIPICVTRDGRVIVVEDWEPARTRFVNSDLAAFGLFLMLFQQYRINVRDLVSERDIQHLIAETESRMAVTDPPALESENFWAIILEQARDGLL